MSRVALLPLLLLAWLLVDVAAGADEAPSAPASPAEGRRLLLEKAYLPATFDQEVFEALWQVWPEPLRAEAAAADAATRRAMAFRRYGLTPRPDDPDGPPLQYVVGTDGGWSMSCLACHGGALDGQVVPGLPNAQLALQTLVEDVLAAKRLLGRPRTPSDLAARVFPHGGTVGTTNAVMFSVSLLQFRDEDLEVVVPQGVPVLRHHDLDAPPWWYLHRKSRLYIDGFAPKNARTLMQFTLVPTNGKEKLLSWERDFEHILAYLESLRPPTWPHEVNAVLAARGRRVFEANCASCHGTYGDGTPWPGVTVPIADIRTDSARLEAITPAMRGRYARSWLTGYDPERVVLDPDGYVAPPLDGVWASAPYLHNGSVPTLWHMLHPEARPVAWRRDPVAYDPERVGLVIETADAVPEGLDAAERRRWYDTTERGKSAGGHLYPARLTPAERLAVLEYLKTL